MSDWHVRRHGIPALTREGCDTSKTGVQKTVSDADGWGTEPCRDEGNNLLLPVMSFGDVTVRRRFWGLFELA